jgi:CHAT domain-containing protein
VLLCTIAWVSLVNFSAAANPLPNPKACTNEISLPTLAKEKAEAKLQDAQEQLNLARQIVNPVMETWALWSLGNAYQDLQKTEDAVRTYESAIVAAQKTRQSHIEGFSWSSLGTLWEKQLRCDRAIEAYEKAVVAFENSGDQSSQVAFTRSQLGSIQLKMNKILPAIQSLEKAALDFETLRIDLSDPLRITTFQRQLYTYRLWQEALIKLPNPEIGKALEVAERGRARAFVHLLSERIEGIPRLEFPNLARIQQIAKEQNATLVEYSFIQDQPVVGALKRQPATLLIWVVQPTGKFHLRSVNLATLSSPIDTLVQNAQNSIIQNEAIEDIDGAEIKIRFPQLQALHQILIQPIAELLPKDPESSVIFIPHGGLFALPFAALQDTSGEYLITKHTVSVAPAIEVLDLARKQHQRLLNNSRNPLVAGIPRQPLVIGNPLNNLSQAELEAKEVAALLQTRPLLKEEATKSAILSKIRQASILHFATHGEFKNVDALQSYILFTDQGQKNSKLTASELLNFTQGQKLLNAKLAVLSACETGVGTITGDGVIGLSRSFIAAGVPSLVVSLWKINADAEQSTVILMKRFYQTLKQGKNKPQALRQAMLNLIQKRVSPRYWAAFTLIGDIAAIDLEM